MKTLLLLLVTVVTLSAVEINVDASAGRLPISPCIYGRNNSLSDNPNDPTSAADWQKYRDAGVRIFRENGGNNSTKYNWQRRLTSHPDWYNNVYAHNWTFSAESLQDNMPGARGLWAFQLIGWAAANSSHNFNDWNYNGSQWWEGVGNNWAGGGGPNTGDGDPGLYLEDWDAVATTAVLEDWIGRLGLDAGMLQYWNMDNEPEVWSSTHDDVIPAGYTAESYLQQYFAVAKEARKLYPEIKLLGPVSTNEWQWYNWENDKISAGGKSYVWLEYFIKRVAEEQQATGVRLLDVLDIHFYPGENNPQDIVQLHRVFFDRQYTYPGANGVKRAGTSAWSDNIRQEYIFGRCNDWLEKYMGPEHGVTMSLTELGFNGENPNVTAVCYASILGTFANNGVEVFTPWTWKIGMWEALHLASRYNKSTSVQSTSSVDEFVSAYASINHNLDSLTIMLVNRSLSETQAANINLQNFVVADGSYPAKRLANLPSNETFVSHSNNALVNISVDVAAQQLSMSLPPLSITSVLLTGTGSPLQVHSQPQAFDLALSAYPNPFNPLTQIRYNLDRDTHVQLALYDLLGRRVQTLVDGFQSAGTHQLQLDGTTLTSGMYLLHLQTDQHMLQQKIMLLK